MAATAVSALGAPDASADVYGNGIQLVGTTFQTGQTYGLCYAVGSVRNDLVGGTVEFFDNGKQVDTMVAGSSAAFLEDCDNQWSTNTAGPHTLSVTILGPNGGTWSSDIITVPIAQATANPTPDGSGTSAGSGVINGLTSALGCAVGSATASVTVPGPGAQPCRTLS